MYLTLGCTVWQHCLWLKVLKIQVYLALQDHDSVIEVMMFQRGRCPVQERESRACPETQTHVSLYLLRSWSVFFRFISDWWFYLTWLGRRCWFLCGPNHDKCSRLSKPESPSVTVSPGIRPSENTPKTEWETGEKRIFFKYFQNSDHLEMFWYGSLIPIGFIFHVLNIYLPRDYR